MNHHTSSETSPRKMNHRNSVAELTHIFFQMGGSTIASVFCSVRLVPRRRCERMLLKFFCWVFDKSHRIQVWYTVFTYIYHKDQPNVGNYTSPMDPMGVLWDSLWNWGWSVPHSVNSMILFASTVTYFGLSRLPVTVTTRIITYLVGDSGIPINLHLPLASWEGATPKTYCISRHFQNSWLVNQPPP